MSDNMSDMMKNINSMMEGKEIPDNIKDMLNSIMANKSNNNDNSSTINNTTDEKSTDGNTASSPDFSNIDINTILKMQQIMKSMNTEQSNSRANLLRSLKPYLKPSRQSKVDQYIQLLNMGNIFEMLNKDGGGKK